MSLYKPTYTDKKTGERRQADTWWYEFILAGKRVRESANTASKTVAREAERKRRAELERALAGVQPEPRTNRIRSVAEVIREYLSGYSVGHRPKSIQFAEGRLANVTRLLGTALLSDLDEGKVRGYMKARLAEDASGRTINMEVGELSRAIGKHWSVLWPKVRKLEERKDVGKALSSVEERKLLDAIAGDLSPNRSQTLGTVVRVALLTGMRAGEITSLTWGQVDFIGRTLTVGRAKTSSGTGRVIPMNPDLFAVLSAHLDWFTERFGAAHPGYHLFPFGKPTPSDPTRHITDVTGAWDALRKRAGVECRLHDLRHTAATKMAEAGVAESTMLAIMGHMSRAMLERYSHIRMAAKRDAVQALSLSVPKVETSDGVLQEVPKVRQTATIQ